jgi:hypothetical protein
LIQLPETLPETARRAAGIDTVLAAVLDITLATKLNELPLSAL